MLLCGRNAKFYTVSADQRRDIRNLKEAFVPAHVLLQGSILAFILMFLNFFYNCLNLRLCTFYVLLCIGYPISSVRSGAGPLNFTLPSPEVVFHRRLGCIFTAQEGVLYPCTHSLPLIWQMGCRVQGNWTVQAIGTDHISTVSLIDTCRNTSVHCYPYLHVY